MSALGVPYPVGICADRRRGNHLHHAGIRRRDRQGSFHAGYGTALLVAAGILVTAGVLALTTLNGQATPDPECRTEAMTN